MAKVDLTMARIEAAQRAARECFLWDSKVPGLGVRVRPTGRAVFVVQYRTDGSRLAQQRRQNLGQVGQIDIPTARRRARDMLGSVAAGIDPAAEREREHQRRAATLAVALEAYGDALKARRVVNAAWYLSALRRHLAEPLGPAATLEDLGRAQLVGLVERLEAAGKPGAAQELRQRMTAFFGWCVDTGRLAASPLAGLRRPRQTRAQRLESPGRALTDDEIRRLWHACESDGWPFGDYVRVLLLCGQRRTETAAMRWQNVDLDAALWRIPAAHAKTGKAHVVPLPGLVRDIIARCPRLAENEHVFAGRGGAAMSGWSKRLPRLIAAAGIAPFTLHDCRRTFRSGLSRLGVAYDVAELMLAHRREDLTQRYDRADLWPQRVEAAERWATHVAGLLADRGNVAPLRKRRAK
jgi:integrase